ncbi:hypothetical protein ON010_g14894 [Phytophthora cinnamomi]|nr:hypothetical protein ON010_g14894 [Phytophthora cinnamomi]
MVSFVSPNLHVHIPFTTLAAIGKNGGAFRGSGLVCNEYPPPKTPPLGRNLASATGGGPATENADIEAPGNASVGDQARENGGDNLLDNPSRIPSGILSNTLSSIPSDIPSGIPLSAPLSTPAGNPLSEIGDAT